jgi:hypothetical protein
MKLRAIKIPEAINKEIETLKNARAVITSDYRSKISIINEKIEAKIKEREAAQNRFLLQEILPIRTGATSIADAARRHGVSPSAIQNWLKMAENLKDASSEL